MIVSVSLTSMQWLRPQILLKIFWTALGNKNVQISLISWARGFRCCVLSWLRKGREAQWAGTTCWGSHTDSEVGPTCSSAPVRDLLCPTQVVAWLPLSQRCCLMWHPSSAETSPHGAHLFHCGSRVSAECGLMHLWVFTSCPCAENLLRTSFHLFVYILLIF